MSNHLGPIFPSLISNKKGCSIKGYGHQEKGMVIKIIYKIVKGKDQLRVET